MLLVYIYVALAAYNTGHLTLKMTNIETIVDRAANVMRPDGTGSMESSWDKMGGKKSSSKSQRKGTKLPDKPDFSMYFEGTDAVMDVPLGGVCEILYGGRGEDDEPSFPR